MCLVCSNTIGTWPRARSRRLFVSLNSLADQANANLQPVNGPDLRLDSDGRHRTGDTEVLFVARRQSSSYLFDFGAPVPMIRREMSPTYSNNNQGQHDCEYLDLKLFAYCKSFFTTKWAISRNVMRLLIEYFRQFRWSTLNRSTVEHHHHHHHQQQQQQQERPSIGILRGVMLRNENQEQAQLAWSIHDELARGTNNQQQDDPGSNQINQQNTQQLALSELIKVLKQTKLFNFLLLISYTVLLIKSIHYESLINYWMQAQTLTVENFQSRVLHFGLDLGHHQAQCHDSSALSNVMMQQTNDEATSWCAGKSSSSSSTTNLNERQDNNLVNGTDICYYLLIVTLMDFLNNLNWCHAKRTIIPVGRAPLSSGRADTTVGSLSLVFRLDTTATWLKSTLHILSSPRHLFQAAHVGLIMAMGPLPGTLGCLIGVHNLLNQAARHGFNLFRVCHYLDYLLLFGKRNNLRPLINENIGHHHQIDDDGQLCEQHWNVGWSNWPVSLPYASCKFGNLLIFERYLMMSQMLGVKVTIFTLLIHLDALQFCYSLRSFMLFTCLVESFLTMHSQYDKYYSRYVQQCGGVAAH